MLSLSFVVYGTKWNESLTTLMQMMTFSAWKDHVTSVVIRWRCWISRVVNANSQKPKWIYSHPLKWVIRRRKKTPTQCERVCQSENHAQTCIWMNIPPAWNTYPGYLCVFMIGLLLLTKPLNAHLSMLLKVYWFPCLVSISKSKERVVVVPLAKLTQEISSKRKWTGGLWT